ncbi:unnamed protein product [Heligmosomoides polygyrus]|uniref:Reverse transcriptase domain-containing protein n=1 Tax=Heligmosomoides polygyrus TaxID=6339 RepID=A0A183GFZ4_HELPZ|nr:unnamed protein product [Heligmosomoides polygyrus]
MVYDQLGLIAAPPRNSSLTTLSLIVYQLLERVFADEHSKSWSHTSPSFVGHLETDLIMIKWTCLTERMKLYRDLLDFRGPHGTLNVHLVSSVTYGSRWINQDAT